MTHFTAFGKYHSTPIVPPVEILNVHYLACPWEAIGCFLFRRDYSTTARLPFRTGNHPSATSSRQALSYQSTGWQGPCSPPPGRRKCMDAAEQPVTTFPSQWYGEIPVALPLSRWSDMVSRGVDQMTVPDRAERRTSPNQLDIKHFNSSAEPFARSRAQRDDASQDRGHTKDRPPTCAIPSGPSGHLSSTSMSFLSSGKNIQEAVSSSESFLQNQERAFFCWATSLFNKLLDGGWELDHLSYITSPVICRQRQQIVSLFPRWPYVF